MTALRADSVRNRLSAVVSALLLTGLIVGPAEASESVAAPPAADQQSGSAEEKLAPVVIVLDASGSMNEADPSGGTKLAAAKAALNGMLDSMPDDAEVGLVVYGSRDAADDDKERGCRDIQTVFPVARLDRSAMTTAVDGIKALGWTPIGDSLLHAADELPTEGARSIVLISDGEETCAPPEACEAAKQLDDAGLDLVMHTVGYGVNSTARRELECIAEAGGGEYIDAPDGNALRGKLPLIVERALRSYQAEGKPVTGGAGLDAAPALMPGQYVDKLNSGDKRYYRLDVPDGMTVHAAATIVQPFQGPPERGADIDQIVLRLINRDGDWCQESKKLITVGDWVAQETAAVRSTLDSQANCFNDEGEYFLEIERGNAEFSFGLRDIEILVAFEPPVSTDHGKAPGGPVEFSDPGGPKQEAVGGGSFNKATELTSSGVYTDKIGYGEAIYYRVPVEWGQALAYQARIGDMPVATEDPVIANVGTTLFNPVRSHTPDHSVSHSYDGKAHTFEAIRTVNVYQGNRTAGDDIALAGIAGDYYIEIALKPDWQGEQADIPVELHLQVVGDPIDPPDYQQVGDFPAELMYEAPVETDDEPTTTTPTDDTTQAADSDDDSASSDDDTESILDNSAVLVLGGIALVLLLTVGVLVGILVGRRGRTGSARQ